MLNTHRYNSNVIWRTVSRRVVGVIRWYDLIHEYARSRYFYNNMFINKKNELSAAFFFQFSSDSIFYT